MKVKHSYKAKSGAVQWQSPSNIALVKYWGKHGIQLPRNPSLSITLKESVTTTEIEFEVKKDAKELRLEFFFENEPAEDFEKRIHHFLSGQYDRYPFLKKLNLRINSSNTFPHSSGIASSASAFSALALCILSIGEKIGGESRQESDFLMEASELSRLGSGSASRSLYGGYVVWGAHPEFDKYSDNYAVPVSAKINSVFNDYHDAILIVSGEKKKVGSSAGHALMEGHPFAKARYDQANQNLVELHKVLENGDLDQFVEIVENEALSLHGLMMSSNPGYLLMQYNTIQIIEKVRAFRKDTKVPICFTLDAGPNVHLLYPLQNQNEVSLFIRSELLSHCDNNNWIDDRMGEGPVKIH